MHYRIQPPAEWIVSSSEDESMSTIDLDLSELEDGAEFTTNSDLLKCVQCGGLWSDLNEDGVCQTCDSIIVDDAAASTYSLGFNDNAPKTVLGSSSLDASLLLQDSTALSQTPCYSPYIWPAEPSKSSDDVLVILDACYAASPPNSIAFDGVSTPQQSHRYLPVHDEPGLSDLSIGALDRICNSCVKSEFICTVFREALTKRRSCH